MISFLREIVLIFALHSESMHDIYKEHDGIHCLVKFHL